MPDVFEPPDEETTEGVASRRWGDGDQPTRAEAKVGLAVAALLLALYGVWVWQPFDAGRDSGCHTMALPNGAESLVCPPEPPEPFEGTLNRLDQTGSSLRP